MSTQSDSSAPREVYLGTIAKQLVNDLVPILQIDAVTRNSALLGDYTEAAIRRLVRRIVQPMRICTGAVIDDPLPDRLRQIDIIIWAPYPAPAIFEVEDFGLVPKSSAFGVLEVKKTNHGASVMGLESFLEAVESGEVVYQSPRPIMPEADRTLFGLGVVCVLQKRISRRLHALLDARKAVAIFDTQDRTRQPQVREKDVLELVNFLYRITWRHAVLSSSPSYPQIVTDSLSRSRDSTQEATTQSAPTSEL